MTRRRLVVWIVVVICGLAAIGAAFILLPRWYAESNEPAVRSEPSAPPAARRIKARLLYIAPDGLRLLAIERDVLFGEGTLEQARRIVEAQLEAAPSPLASPVPAGTKLRALYLGPSGEAYVDLSRDVSSAHSGGALDEILTVYALVDALTMNLPAVTAVQILVDGREVDTLAGHVDLRRPLLKNTTWIEELQTAPAPPAGALPPAGTLDTPPPAGPPGGPATKSPIE
ncbi:MAG TPA: GerMN domain-containing protein [Vicinamibacterales bacterium]|jgi:hypothetical protein